MATYRWEDDRDAGPGRPPGARHKATRPYRPQTNGKPARPGAERFIHTMLNEWAYTKLYRSNEERVQTLPRWGLSSIITVDPIPPGEASPAWPPL